MRGGLAILRHAPSTLHLLRQSPRHTWALPAMRRPGECSSQATFATRADPAGTKAKLQENFLAAAKLRQAGFFSPTHVEVKMEPSAKQLTQLETRMG